MPELLRRVAVLTIVSAIGIAALTPLTARSAAPASAETDRLLAAADAPASPLSRGHLDGRELSAAVTLRAINRPIAPESLGLQPAVATRPPAAPMEATLYTKPTPRPAVAATFGEQHHRPCELVLPPRRQLSGRLGTR